MRAVDIIRKKRDALELTRQEIEFLIEGATRDRIPDYQIAAWLMAVFLRGMTRAELAALTEAMLHSGVVLDFSDLPAPKVDKHSTGGVGDKTSLVIAPVVAAAGLYVPMISGRGLGHSGGTLDKLESIPGFNVNLRLEEFRLVLEQCHCSLIGQTPEIAPADKKLYALRDVTATVESPYLICASIMSKKMAEGIDALVLDVKTGDGAFMKKQSDAEYLAQLMVETGTRMGKESRRAHHRHGTAARPQSRQRAGSRRMHRDPGRQGPGRPPRNLRRTFGLDVFARRAIENHSRRPRARRGNDCIRAAPVIHSARSFGGKAATRKWWKIPVGCRAQNFEARITAPQAGFVTAFIASKSASPA